MPRLHSDAEIADITILRKLGLTWDKVAKRINAKYFTTYTDDAVRAAYARWGDSYNTNEDSTKIRMLRETAATKRRASFLAKENKLLLEKIMDEEDLVERLSSSLKGWTAPKLKKKKGRNASKNPGMIVETLVSDIHVGLKTKTFDAEVLTKRMQDYADQILDKIYRYEQQYSIKKLILVLGGDIAQSATMHSDSAATCHLTNSEQVVTSINILHDFICLLKQYVDVEVKAVCGNHDRTSGERIVVKPGKTHMTWIVYRMLEKLNPDVPFEIPESFHTIYEIFGKNYLFEHGHLLPKPSQNALRVQRRIRADQFKTPLAGIRHGHYHFATVWGREDISNGTAVTDDEFSASLGYSQEPTQVTVFHGEDGYIDASIMGLSDA